MPRMPTWSHLRNECKRCSRDEWCAEAERARLYDESDTPPLPLEPIGPTVREQLEAHEPNTYRDFLGVEHWADPARKRQLR